MSDVGRRVCGSRRQTNYSRYLKRAWRSARCDMSWWRCGALPTIGGDICCTTRLHGCLFSSFFFCTAPLLPLLFCLLPLRVSLEARCLALLGSPWRHRMEKKRKRNGCGIPFSWMKTSTGKRRRGWHLGRLLARMATPLSYQAARTT